MFQKISLAQAERILGDVPSEKCFYARSGKVIRNLHELERMLPQLSAEEFSHHCNKERNDFSNWMADVLEDEWLAKKIRKVLDAQKAAAIIAKRIASLDGHIDRERTHEHALEENIFSRKEQIVTWSLVTLCALLFFIGVMLAWNLVK